MASKADGLEAEVVSWKVRVTTEGEGIVLRVIEVRTPKVEPPPCCSVSQHQHC